MRRMRSRDYSYISLSSHVHQNTVMVRQNGCQPVSDQERKVPASIRYCCVFLTVLVLYQYRIGTYRVYPAQMLADAHRPTDSSRRSSVRYMVIGTTDLVTSHYFVGNYSVLVSPSSSVRTTLQFQRPPPSPPSYRSQSPFTQARKNNLPKPTAETLQLLDNLYLFHRQVAKQELAPSSCTTRRPYLSHLRHNTTRRLATWRPPPDLLWVTILRHAI